MAGVTVVDVSVDVLSLSWPVEISANEFQGSCSARVSRKIALGLYEENSGLLMYDGLIWIPDNDTLRLRILRDHHDAQVTVAGGPVRLFPPDFLDLFICSA